MPRPLRLVLVPKMRSWVRPCAAIFLKNPIGGHPLLRCRFFLLIHLPAAAHPTCALDVGCWMLASPSPQFHPERLRLFFVFGQFSISSRTSSTRDPTPSIRTRSRS